MNARSNQTNLRHPLRPQLEGFCLHMLVCTHSSPPPPPFAPIRCHVALQHVFLSKLEPLCFSLLARQEKVRYQDLEDVHRLFQLPANCCHHRQQDILLPRG